MPQGFDSVVLELERAERGAAGGDEGERRHRESVRRRRRLWLSSPQELSFHAIDIPIAVATGILGIFAGFLGTAYKSRKALESEYDISLRKARIDVYTKLWKELEVLAKYSPPPFSRKTVEDLSLAMRSWYFEEGGLDLSKQARNKYFDLQEALVQTLATTPETTIRHRCGSCCGSAEAVSGPR